MKKSPIFLFCLKGFFILLFIINFLSAQTYTISGKLRSESTKSPIAYANIVVEGTDEGTVSSSSGKFHLKVSAIPVTLRISHIGYAEMLIEAKGDVGIIFMTPTILMGEEVLVTSTRAIEGETPVAFSALEREDIEKFYSHQDVPMVLSDLPGVYSYSDAGNGVGYTYLKIRGFSQDRIGVMLNGIPLNDPEAHAVYWVDHGDILSAAGDIQLQRGVGNSLYGSSVFGGTVNMITNFHSLYPGLTVTMGYGNYMDESRLNLPSEKLSMSYAGGPWMEKGITVYARYSALSSDGYRKGSGTEQRSGHVGIEKNSATSMTRVEAILGNEETAFSWEGVIPLYEYDLDNREDRRYNYYADPTWNGGRNNANKDVFRQSIISLQHSRKFGNSLFSLTIYNVKGDGYYEQFKGGRDLIEYNLTDVLPDTIEGADLIRRKWLKNGYWGFVYQYSHPFSLGVLTVGGDTRFYSSDHFGKVIEVDGGWSVPNDHRYYSDHSNKRSFSFYIHSSLNLTEGINVLADIRYLGHRYSFDQDVLGAFTKGYNFKLKYDFLDPHLGIRFNVRDDLSIFANISMAHREPADGDIYDHDDPDATPAIKEILEEEKTDVGGFSTPRTKEEFLIDYEAGLSFSQANILGTINLYRMDFRDELIPLWYRYYDADNVLQANAPRTIHQGIELNMDITSLSWLRVNGNVSLSDNRFVEFFGDSLGWGGWGGIADYSNNVIPAYPDLQIKLKAIAGFGITESWLQILYVGKQYIDFANTEDVAIDPYTVINLGSRVEIPTNWSVKPVLTFWVNNVFDTLYETFGYNYYDGWPPYRVDAYWPAATRNFYATLTLQF